MTDQNLQYNKTEEAEESGILNQFNLGKLLFVIRKNLLFLIFIISLSFACVYLFLRYTKQVFEASSLLKLEFKSSTQFLNFDVGPFNNGIDGINMAGEIELIRTK